MSVFVQITPLFPPFIPISQALLLISLTPKIPTEPLRHQLGNEENAENAIPGICFDTCSPHPIFSTGPISRCCTPPLPLHYSQHTDTVQPRRAGTQLSSTALPPIPSPPTSVNFAHRCTVEHRPGILIKGYTRSFSPGTTLYPTESLTAPPCQADKKPPLIKTGSKLPRSFFALKRQSYIWPFSLHLHESFVLIYFDQKTHPRCPFQKLVLEHFNICVPTTL